MKMRIPVLLSALFVALALAQPGRAQTYDTNTPTVTTLVGSGLTGFADGNGTTNSFNGPDAIVADSQGNKFVFDYYNFRIRQVYPNLGVTNYAGGGQAGYPEGSETYTNTTLRTSYYRTFNLTVTTNVTTTTNGQTVTTTTNVNTVTNFTTSFSNITTLTNVITVSRIDTIADISFTPGALDLGGAVAMTIDHADNLWVVVFPTNNMVSLLRIQTDGLCTYFPLPGITASALTRVGVCADSANNIYVSDFNGNRIYRYRSIGNTNTFEVFAGSGNYGLVNGNGLITSFANPSTLAADAADNIYVWDTGNRVIRRISPNQEVISYAGHYANSNADGKGTNAVFTSVSAMCADEIGNLYVACYSTNGGDCIRRISPATNVTTVAGHFTQHGYVNGVGATARFDTRGNMGLCYSQGSLYVADTFNHRIRQIAFNPAPAAVSYPGFNVSLYAGVTIPGTVGRSYLIQSSADTTNWTTRATVTLPSTPYLWMEPSPVGTNMFYRTFLLP